MQPFGSPVPPQPEADFTLVKYWADWCVPCRELDRALAEVLARHPELTVNILSVEADPGKTIGRGGGKGEPADGTLMIDASSLPDDLRRRLEEGELTPEDMKRLEEAAKEEDPGPEN